MPIRHGLTTRGPAPSTFVLPRLATLGLCLCLAGLAAADGAHARQPKSQYTSLTRAECRPSGASEDDRAGLICPGFKGYPVRLWQRDGADVVSISASERPTRAQTQRVGTGGTLYHDAGRRAVVEWRLDPRSIAPRPRAAILRFVLTEAGAQREVLVVIRTDPGQSCHVAHVATAGRPEAIRIAREAADQADTFDCAGEPQQL